MTSVQNDRDFIKTVLVSNIPDGILGDAIDWINKNLSPEDVFDVKHLQGWARDVGFIKPDEIDQK